MTTWMWRRTRATPTVTKYPRSPHQASKMSVQLISVLPSTRATRMYVTRVKRYKEAVISIITQMRSISAATHSIWLCSRPDCCSQWTLLRPPRIAKGNFNCQRSHRVGSEVCSAGPERSDTLCSSKRLHWSHWTRQESYSRLLSDLMTHLRTYH